MPARLMFAANAHRRIGGGFAPPAITVPGVSVVRTNLLQNEALQSSSPGSFLMRQNWRTSQSFHNKPERAVGVLWYGTCGVPGLRYLSHLRHTESSDELSDHQ